MKNQRLKQFAASLLVVLSLFVSSVAACCCSHHQEEKVETDAPPCHQHSSENHSGETNRSAGILAKLDANGDCICIQTAPRVLAKSEVVKIEKQAATVSPGVTISVELTARITTSETSDFVKSFHLSDSFYNIKSPRAPPIL
jgi:hypothetical protein